MRLIRALLLSACALFVAIPAWATYCVPPKAPAAPPAPEPNPPVCDPQCHNCSASPCYPAFGTYVDETTDLRIPTAGFPLTVSRRYDSARPTDGPLGAGWSSSLTARLYYAAYLQAAPNTYSYEADVMMPSGSVFRFTSAGSTFSPPFGRRDTLVHNGNGTWTLTLQNSRTIYLFGADGSLQSITDGYGNAITFTYDGNGRVQRMADAAGSGRYVDVTWGPNGRIASVTDHSGHTFKYFYESVAATLTSVSDPLVSSDASQRTTYYTYVSGRFGPVISRIEDRWHRLISDIAWQSDGKLKSYTEGAYNNVTPSLSTGEKYTYTYSTSSVNKTDSFGTRTFTFNADGQITDRVTYNAAGQPATTIDDLGNSTGYTYNARGNVATMTRGGLTFSYTYDGTFQDQVASITPNPAASWPGSRYTYFPAGSPAPGALKEVFQIRKDGTTADLIASYTYNSRGQVATSTVYGVDTEYFYNAAGDLTSAHTSLGTTCYSYDSLGRTTSSTDATGQSTSYSYDALGRVTGVTLPKPSTISTLNFTTTYVYDEYDPSDGLAYTRVTDPNGRVTRQGYDGLGKLSKSIDAAGNATLYSYQYNLLRSIADANANVTTYSYDGNRNLASTTFPDGNIERYVTGVAGTLTQVTDRRGMLTRYTYDAFNHVVKIEYLASNVTVNYSWLGNLPSGSSEVANNVLKYTDVIEYDDRFRLQKEERLGGYKITYSYILGDPKIAGYTVTPPSGSSEPPITLSYGYGAGGVTSISASTIPGSFTYTYTQNGQYDTITFPNGQQRKYEYDLQGRLTHIANTLPGLGNVVDYQYGYDYNWATSAYTMLGQRTGVTTNTASNTGGQPNGLTKYYYDVIYQLTKATYPDATSDEWTYDAIGNRTSAKMSGALANYTYDQNTAGNNTTRLRSYTGSNTFTYDANGNMLAGPNGSFTWDHANCLSTFGPQVFEYDARGRRTSTGVPSAPLSLINQGLNVVRERDSYGTRNDYIFGPGIDEPLARQSASGAVTYFVVDGLGSITATVENGAPVDGARYRPFGTGGPPAQTRFGYTAREAVAGDLYYYRSRYYDGSLGRFISEDPVRFRAGVNFYSYTRSDPVNYRDPSGLFAAAAVEVVVVVGGVVIVGGMLWGAINNVDFSHPPFPTTLPPLAAKPPNWYPPPPPSDPSKYQPKYPDPADYPHIQGPEPPITPPNVDQCTQICLFAGSLCPGPAKNKATALCLACLISQFVDPSNFK